MFPAVRSMHHMIGAGNPFEVEAGYRILEQGGNAIDAGVAAVFAATVTEQDHIGLGGEMPLLIKLPGKPVIAISGVGVAGAKATVDFYTSRQAEPWEERPIPPIPGAGIRAAITPGLVDGLLLALEKYGTMSFSKVIEPAIEYADGGFPLPEIFSSTLTASQRTLSFIPSSQKFYFPNGTIPKPGEVVKFPDLARTLREMAATEKSAHGDRVAKLRAVHDYFYKGSIAKRIVDYNEANGGLITYNDLASFHAETDEARTTTYRGYTINKPGFWTQGPVMLRGAEYPGRFRPEGDGSQQPAVSAHRAGGREARVRRS